MELSCDTSHITVNGKRYSGNSLSIVNSEIVIDGKPIETIASEMEVDE